METKLIQVTIEIEDNQFIEAQLVERLRFLVGGSIKEFKTLKSLENENI